MRLDIGVQTGGNAAQQTWLAAFRLDGSTAPHQGAAHTASVRFFGRNKENKLLNPKLSEEICETGGDESNQSKTRRKP